MKTPAQMLKDIAGEMTDATITLELIYKNAGNSCETDSGASCVLRSLLSTNEKAQRYIKELTDSPTILKSTERDATRKIN